MSKYTFTDQAKQLYEALIAKGIHATKEHWDGHKHIDIAVEPAKIYIEVDGMKHYTNSKQIEADFKRDHYSDREDFNTIRIPNIIIENHLEEVVEAISEVILNRLQKNSQ